MSPTIVALLFLAAGAHAQVSLSELKPGVTGTFIVNIDDYARIYLNGVEVLRTTSLGKTKSDELALKPGDRIVLQLQNLSSPRYFIMVFVAADKSQVVSFPRQSFKILVDSETKDFTQFEFRRLSKTAKADSRKTAGLFPFKHNSEYLWGEFDECALACIVTREMFGPFRQP